YRQIAEGIYYDPNSGENVEYSHNQINSEAFGPEKTLGYWPANPLGIYGMSNNIKEWVNDWYAKDYYLDSPAMNPKGPSSGEKKVMRDGDGLMTFGRSGEYLEQEKYSALYSFRCSLQQETPTIK
ncbi:SUMF1/EgtB/PvdO family nonheme iron enzyme, partial [Photobacterium halotolerans]